MTSSSGTAYMGGHVLKTWGIPPDSHSSQQHFKYHLAVPAGLLVPYFQIPCAIPVEWTIAVAGMLNSCQYLPLLVSQTSLFWRLICQLIYLTPMTHASDSACPITLYTFTTVFNSRNRKSGVKLIIKLMCCRFIQETKIQEIVQNWWLLWQVLNCLWNTLLLCLCTCSWS